MAEIRCFHCKKTWALGTAHTNHCPDCGWVTEIYYDEAEAKRVADLYNSQSPPLPEPSGFEKLIGINGYAVAFPDQGRLATTLGQLLD